MIALLMLKVFFAIDLTALSTFNKKIIRLIEFSMIFCPYCLSFNRVNPSLSNISSIEKVCQCFVLETARNKLVFIQFTVTVGVYSRHLDQALVFS